MTCPKCGYPGMGQAAGLYTLGEQQRYNANLAAMAARSNIQSRIDRKSVIKRDEEVRRKRIVSAFQRMGP